MGGWKSVGRALPSWLALAVVALAWGAYGLRESALAAVVDPVGPGILLASVGLTIAVAGLFLLRRLKGGFAGRGVAVVAVVGGLAALSLLAWFRVSYIAEDVRFSHGDVDLYGTLYLPRGSGPHGAAVLIHGSGPESRDATAFYARFLARRGIAGLAYDKRGVGESTGDLYKTDYAGYAEDALAAVRSLAARADVNAEAVGLVGFSEAEWVAPLAAIRSDSVAYIAIVGASGRTPAEQVTAEIAMRLRSQGYDDAAVDRAVDVNAQVFAYQRTGEGAQSLASALAEVQDEAWFLAAEDIPAEVYPLEMYDWWRSVMDFDATDAWRRVTVPVLLLKGGRDDRSPPDVMRRKIVGALASGGNPDVRVAIFPSADHMLLEWHEEGWNPLPRLADGYPDVVAEWILARIGDIED